MDKEMKETVLQAVDYANVEAERYHKRIRICIASAMLLLLAYYLMKGTSLYENPTVVRALDLAQGFAVGILLVGLLFSSRYGARIKAFKERVMKRQG